MEADGNLVGLSALELVLRLPSLQPLIRQLSFVIFTPYAGVENRARIESKVPLESRSVAEFLELRPPIVLLDELLRHDARPKRELVHVKTRDLSVAQLNAMVRRLPEGAALGLCSVSQLRNKARTMHIPMMDFRVPPSEAGLTILREALYRMGFRRGALLDSGRSYHFYGFDLMNRDQWWEFMARSLLVAPLVDVRYIAHRLLEGTGILRLTSTPLKPRTPVVVGCL
ncbi:primase 1D-like protein [Sorangium sp. So ce296]|uniref:primase 1D-like protein n=1 Tax=Sorangium sp. So ce296 TaxID=3133296 RepID=UPI003F61DF60